MTQIVSKNHSIYVQLLYLLTGAAIAAIVFFQIFYSTGNYVLDYYLENSAYVEKQNLKYLAKMQKYVTAEHISSSDIAQLNTWVQRQKMIYVRIYKDQIQIYDSDYPKEDVSVSELRRVIIRGKAIMIWNCRYNGGSNDIRKFQLSAI